jgi:hypothetical protein
MAGYCSWCQRKIQVTPQAKRLGDSDLCLDCLLTFIGGSRPERRRTERRRYASNPPVERRGQSDRRRR